MPIALSPALRSQLHPNADVDTSAPRAATRTREAPAATTSPTAALVHYTYTDKSEAAVRARLERYRDGYSGPYFVAGARVVAPAQFRMVGGFNDANAGCVVVHGAPHADPKNARLRELLEVCSRAHLPYPGRCLMGCPEGHELARVTQALIDAGKLPAGDASLPDRIKSLQWHYGIGIDCTDYVLGAALAAHGQRERDVAIRSFGVALPAPGIDYFATATTNPHLQRVEVAAARAGDVFCLDDPGSVGHRAVVYERHVCGDDELSALRAKFGSDCSAFFVGGAVHQIEVDSSWGAGDQGASYGGVRRDTWLFNASTGAWAQLDKRVSADSEPVFRQTGRGPAGEVLRGIFRFK